MGSKLRPGQFDCIAAALPDEPMFALLARDRSAPAMLRAWSDQRRKDVLARHDRGEISADEMESDLRKCSEADGCADDMTVWRKRNDGRWRDGADLRPLAALATADERAAIEAAVIRAVADACSIPSQFHSGAMAIGAHDQRLVRSPLFSARRHLITLVTEGRFEALNRDAAEMTERYAIQAVDVADVEVLDRSPDRLVLELIVVVA